MYATRSCLFLLPLLAAASLKAEEEAKPRPRGDLTKSLRIERPAEEVLVKSAPAAQPGQQQLAAPQASGPQASVPQVPPQAVAAPYPPNGIINPEALAIAAKVARLADRGKGDIELPVEAIIARQGSALGNAVLGNGALQFNYAAGIRPNGPSESAPPAGPPAETSTAAFDNPKVEPGKVRWHADFETACAAAEKSGKPVLLFQMMGKLDDRFC
jgi:hypothetical protein